MSTHAGPNIVEDGLVLSLDAANEKSFRGEPTTNELVQITWGGDGGPTVATITDESLMYKGYFTQSVIGGTSRNCYLSGADLSSSRTSDVWTFSCYLRREDRQPITSMNVYMYYPSSDGTGLATIEDVGDGWYRLSRTRTGAVNAIGLAGFTGLVAGIKYYLSGAQLEKKAYPTAYVNTNTTRGTTVATGGGWADLSGIGNNGELVNGVSYNDDNGGSLVFDGVDDTTDFGNVLQLGTESRTYCFWYKQGSTSFSTIVSLLSKTDNGATQYRQSIGFQTNGNFRVILRAQSNANYDMDTVNPKNDTDWHYLSWVINRNSSQFLYQDGILLNSKDISAISNQNFQLNRLFRIGSYNSTSNEPILFFNGHIASVSIYNKPLTIEEIKQNFNALRGRYGI